MNNRQQQLSELAGRQEANIKTLASQLSQARKDLRKTKRELDKAIVADPHAWVAGVTREGNGR